MVLSKSRKQTCVLLLALLTFSLVGNAFVISTVHGSSSQVVHDTLSEFAPGTLNQTVLNGTESAPEIRLGTNTTTAQTWTFQDDDISGWTFTPGGNYLAEENPSGQIHVRAQYVSAQSYGVASRGDVAVPNKFVAEYKVLFDSLQPSGVADPLVTEPTAAGVRIDEVNPTAGLRVEVYSDRIVSFYYSGSGVSYPVNAYIDVQTNTGQWYVLRFECDLGDSNRPADVYRDSVFIGKLRETLGTVRRRLSGYGLLEGFW